MVDEKRVKQTTADYLPTRRRPSHVSRTMTCSLQLVATLIGTVLVRTLNDVQLSAHAITQVMIRGFGKQNGIQQPNSSHRVQRIAVYACIVTPRKRMRLELIWPLLLRPVIGALFAPSRGHHRGNLSRPLVSTRLSAYGNR